MIEVPIRNPAWTASLRFVYFLAVRNARFGIDPCHVSLASLRFAPLR